MSEPVSPEDQSPLAGALARVGDRWAFLLVHALLAGPRRFGDLQDELGRIAPNVLTQRLRHLEREGVVVVEPYSHRPPRVVYRLSAAGGDLASALRLLAQWGAGRADGGEAEQHGADGPRHPACGSVLDARWWCPTCDRVVDDPEADDLTFM